MQIVQATTSPDILESDNEELLLALLSTLSGVFCVFSLRGFISSPQSPLPEEIRADPKQRTIDSILLYALLCVKSSELPSVSAKATKCVEELSTLVTGTPGGIYDYHTQRLLVRYGLSMPVKALADMLAHVTSAAELGPLLKGIFIARLGEIDFAIRVTDELRYFSVLEQVLWLRKVTFSAEDLEEILRVIILPLGGFQPGNVAHLFRKIAVNCLCALTAEPYWHLLANALAADDMSLATRVLTQWASASDSDDGEMRLMCMTTLPDICKLPMTTGSANELVQSVLLRFDDSSDLIRLRTASGLLAVLRSGDNVSPKVLSEIDAQMVPLVKKALVYMDDTEDVVGVPAVLLEVVKLLGDISPNIVVDLIQSALPNCRDQSFGKKALSYITSRH